MLEQTKRWEECSIEEKLERLKYCVMESSKTAAKAYNIATRAQDIALTHIHQKDGLVFVPAVGTYGDAVSTVTRTDCLENWSK